MIKLFYRRNIELFDVKICNKFEIRIVIVATFMIQPVDQNKFVIAYDDMPTFL